MQITQMIKSHLQKYLLKINLLLQSLKQAAQWIGLYMNLDEKCILCV